VYALSGGQRPAVAIARVLREDVRVVILVQRIAGRDDPPDRIVLPPTLEVRDSARREATP
jgi:ABC-type lipoprotein export system ATPase subunit